MDGIYSTKLEPVIAAIDGVIPGFYAMFDSRLKMRYRIANLVLGDELRWFVTDARMLNDWIDRYADDNTKRRLSIPVRKIDKAVERLFWK